MAIKGCGTCRDRKVLCDRTLPTCKSCSRAKRACSGYGLRLSWPKNNDKKRFVVGQSPSTALPSFVVSNAQHINMGFEDLDLHHRLALIESGLSNMKCKPPIPSTAWNQSRISSDPMYLIDYFRTTASNRLQTLGHISESLAGVLLRMAVFDNTPSATAVLHSLLALASLHRYGPQAQAVKLKISALQQLALASKSPITKKQSMEHVAAGMLLYCFETLEVTYTSNFWTWYLSGVMEIIEISSLSTSETDGDASILLDWLCYHDMIARFSTWHWRGPETKISRRPAIRSSSRTTSHQSHLLLSILELLLEVCEKVNTGSQDDERSQKAKNLREYDLLHSRITSISIETSISHGHHRWIGSPELFKLSSLIYLERASGSYLDQVQGHIDQAFELITVLKTCEALLPLFLIGLEARNDNERIMVLDLIDRTPKSMLLLGTKAMIQCCWAQDDLAGKEIAYLDKIVTVINQCSSMITFI